MEAHKAWELGASEVQMKEIQLLIRHAQWRWDFAAAGHGNSFHSPVETLRVISTGLTKAQEARVKLARLLGVLGFPGEIPYPDISTKAKAQEYIGLNASQMNQEKGVFLRSIVPEWLKKAEEREKGYMN